MAARGKIADEFDLRVLVQVGVGMELACDQVVEFPCATGKDEREAMDARVDEADGGYGWCGARTVGARDGQMLAQNEGEGKGQLLVVGQAQEEGRRAVGVGGGVWVLDELDQAFVGRVALGGIAGGGEGIRGDVEEGAVAAGGDVEGCDRDYLWSAWGAWSARAGGLGGLHRVWSRRYRAPPSSAVLCTAPIPTGSGRHAL